MKDRKRAIQGAISYNLAAFTAGDMTVGELADEISMALERLDVLDRRNDVIELLEEIEAEFDDVAGVSEALDALKADVPSMKQT